MTISDRPGEVAAALSEIAAGHPSSSTSTVSPAAPEPRTVAAPVDPVVRRRPTQRVRRADPLGQHPALDGLRALALIAMLLYHARFEWLMGGFLGLTVFFTLSGFLITSLLLREWGRTGRLSLRNFWGRRFRRLIPASWLTLLIVIGMGAVGIWDASQLRSLRGDVPAALLQVLNWRFIVEGHTYGSGFATPSPLEHFWSLAVEEQFYLVLPLAVVGLLAFGDRRNGRLRRTPLVVVLAGATVVSAVLTWHYAQTDMNRAYLGTDTRMSELLFGALLACLLLYRLRSSTVAGRTVFSIAGFAGLVAIGWLCHVATLNSHWLYPWGLLLTTAAATLAILGVLQGGLLAKAVSIAPLVWLGRISYGVYLLHWPVFLWLTPERIGWSQWPLFGLRMAVTLAAAVVMFRLVEQPVRTRALLGQRWAAAAALPVVAIAILATVGLLTNDLPAPSILETASGDGVPAAAPRPVRTLLLGDELAASGQDTMNVEGKSPMKVSVAAAPGCGLALGGWVRTADGAVERDIDRCGPVRQQWLAKVAAERPDVVVIWAGLRDVADRRLSENDTWDGPGGARNNDFLRADVGALIDKVTATGIPVVVLSVPHLRNTLPPAPAPPTTLPTDPAARLLFGIEGMNIRKNVPAAGYAENDDTRIDQWNALLADVVRTRGATFIDVAAEMRSWPGGEFDPDRRSAGVGLTAIGAGELATWMSPKVRDLGPAIPTPDVSASGLSATAPLPAPPPASPRRVVPEGRKPTVAVVGDSVAYGLGFGLSKWTDAANAPLEVVNGGKFGCAVTRGGSYRYLRDIVDFAPSCDWAPRYQRLLVDQNPDVVVLSSGVWEVVDRRFAGDDRWRNIGQPEVDNYILREYLSAIDLLAARGATVVLPTQPHMQAGVTQGFTDLPESDPGRIDRLNQLLAEAVRLRPGTAVLVDQQQWLAQSPGGELDPAKRSDGVHFKDSFEPAIGAWLGPQLIQVARSGPPA